MGGCNFGLVVGLVVGFDGGLEFEASRVVFRMMLGLTGRSETQGYFFTTFSLAARESDAATRQAYRELI